jgi:hypothetical protein
MILWGSCGTEVGSWRCKYWLKSVHRQIHTKLKTYMPSMQLEENSNPRFG